MNGKIDKSGQLNIERAGKMNKQYCPFDAGAALSEGSPCSCGDWCPLFGEPATTETKWISTNDLGVDVNNIRLDTWLEICQNKTLTFDTFTDERKEAEG